MTAIGKILVFLNLLFSLVTAGFIGMVFLTRTNWKTAFDKQQVAVQVATTNLAQVEEQFQKQLAAKDADLQKQVRRADDAEKRVTDALAKVDQAQAQLAAVTQAKDKEAENVKSATAELERRRSEVAQLGGFVNERDRRIVDLEKQLSATREDGVSYKLRYESLREKFDGLLSQYEVASRDLGALRARGIVAPPTGTRTPPPENVRGTISKIDGNYATITVGSDAGLLKDHELKVFRLTPSPEYLGTLTVINVTPFEAVGRLTLTRRQQAKVGDEVASQVIAGGR